MININNLNSITNIQKYNYVLPGQEINSFLSESQITSYQIVDNNVNKNSDITISLKNIQGKAKLFGYFCDYEKDIFCSFASYKLQNKLEEKEMIFPQDNSILEQNIFISNKDNYCYNKKKGKEFTLLVVVQCLLTEQEKSQNQICSFTLSSKITNTPILMSPRKTYYNYLSKDKNDLYEIVISDPDIDNLIVVLSTNIGNAEIKLEQKNNNEYALIKYSQNDYNLPDVIRLKPSDIIQLIILF